MAKPRRCHGLPVDGCLPATCDANSQQQSQIRSLLVPTISSFGIVTVAVQLGCSMTDQMDNSDIHTSSSSGGISESSSSEKLDIKELDLDVLNDHIKILCEDALW